MYKVLRYTELQWSKPNMPYLGSIEKAYEKLTNDDKKKYDALVEGAFKEKYLNPQRVKLEQARLESRCHACHASQNDAHGQTVVNKSHWTESLIRITFIVLSFYTAHALATKDTFECLVAIFALHKLYDKVFV
jgi:hypothetical protein